jgi:hypothetical protein
MWTIFGGSRACIEDLDPAVQNESEDLSHHTTGIL